jgi:hypothetical protein
MRYSSTLHRYVRALAAASMLMAFGAVANATDTYNLSTHQLTIPSIQVGQTVYTDVVVYIAFSQIISISGGPPASVADTYVNGVLTIPQVIVNGRTYTNIAARVTLSDVLYVGGHYLVNLSSAPGEATLEAYLQTSHQYSLSTTYGGNSFTVQLYSSLNSGTTTFNGQAPAYSTSDTVNFYKNGALVVSGVSTSYFLLHPYVPLGSVGSTGIPYALVTSWTPFPVTLTVGSSGAGADITYYHNSSRYIVDANEADSYAVSANNPSTLRLCLNSTIFNTTAQGTNDGLGNDTESDCYTVDASGHAVLASITLSVNGVTLTFQ